MSSIPCSATSSHCPAGHVIPHVGASCPICADMYRKLLTAVYQNTKVHFLGSGYANGNLIFQFACPRGHRWILTQITGQSITCPFCPSSGIHIELPQSPGVRTRIFTTPTAQGMSSSQTFTFRFAWTDVGGSGGSGVVPAEQHFCDAQPGFFREEGELPYTEMERMSAIKWVNENKQRYACCLCLAKCEVGKSETRNKHFRRLALLIHPDKAKGICGTTEAFAILNEANQCLQKMYG